MADKKLCDDLLLEIFLLLPMKPIFRFKCLSKMWYNKLSSPQFRNEYEFKHQSEFPMDLLPLSGFFRFSKMYLIRTSDVYPENHNPGLCFIPSCLDSMPLRSRNFIKKLGVIVASSNGIILCQFSVDTYFVCNPITSHWLRLPTPKLKIEEVALGFFYEELIRDDGSRHPRYVVVRVDCSKGKLHQSVFGVEIYSSDTRVWDSSTLKAAREFKLVAHHGCHVIGHTFYWYTQMCQIIAYDHNRARDGWVWLIEYNDNHPLSLVRPIILGESPEGFLHCGLNYYTSSIMICMLKKRLHCYNHSNPVPATEWIPKVQINIDRPNTIGPSIHMDVIAFHPQNPRFLIIRCSDSCMFWYDVELLEITPLWCLNVIILGRELIGLVPHYQPRWPPLLFQNDLVF